MHCFFQCSSDTMTTVTKVSLSLVSDLKEGYCKFSSFLIRACLHKRFKKNIWAQSYGPKNGGRAGLTEKLLSSHHHLNHLHYHNNKPETLGTLVGWQTRWIWGESFYRSIDLSTPHHLGHHHLHHLHYHGHNNQPEIQGTLVGWQTRWIWGERRNR